MRCAGCRCSRPRSGPTTAPTVVLHGHLDVVPGLRRAVRPAGRGRPPLRARRLRHEGGAGGDAASSRRRCATRTGCGYGSGSSATRSPRRRPSAAATTSSTAASSATSRSPASRPIFTSASRPRGCWRCASRWADGGPRRHALARRQRRAQRDRRFPQHRVATVCPAQLGAVRSPLDQPGPDLGWGRAEQGARPMRDRRRHPLPARTGPRRDPGGSPGPARDRGERRCSHGRRRPSTASRPSCGRCASRRRRTTTASR